MAKHLKFIARTVMVQEGNVEGAYRTLNRSGWPRITRTPDLPASISRCWGRLCVRCRLLGKMRSSIQLSPSHCLSLSNLTQLGALQANEMLTKVRRMDLKNQHLRQIPNLHKHLHTHGHTVIILTTDGLVDVIKRRRYYEKPCRRRQRESYETCRRIYNMEMARKINFLMRKNRADPWLGC